MRKIPVYWASVRENVTIPGDRDYVLTISGSSDLSAADAERDARERLQRLVSAGGPRAMRHEHEYYPDRRLPEELLEEFHSPEGDLIAAITRNRYGAAVLNTDAVLISDIDFPTSDPTSGAGPSGLFARLLGRGRQKQQEHEQEREILDQVAAFSSRHPRLGVRTYRTRNGFRLLVTGSDAAPDSDRARTLLEELRSDQLYITLCRVHDSYRARLTPKPWRIAVDRLESLGTLTAGDERHRAWVGRYEAASRDVAVCRLVSTSGPAPSARERQIIDLHDRFVRPESGLTLA